MGVLPNHLRIILSALSVAALLGACARPPVLLTGEVWRTETATKRIYEMSPSFAMREQFAATFPYWEPMDSGTLAKVNLELREYRPWRPDFRAVEDSFPQFWTGCREDSRENTYFETSLDTIVKYSPFRGTRQEVIDMECFSLFTGNDNMLRGSTKAGKATKIYLGDFRGTCYLMVDNRYYISRPEPGHDRMQAWLNFWKPLVIPPPLPNWPKHIRDRYLNR